MAYISAQSGSPISVLTCWLTACLSQFRRKINGCSAFRRVQNVTKNVFGPSSHEFQVSKVFYILNGSLNGAGKVHGDFQDLKSLGKRGKRIRSLWVLLHKAFQRTPNLTSENFQVTYLNCEQVASPTLKTFPTLDHYFQFIVFFRKKLFLLKVHRRISNLTEQVYW